MGYAVMHNLLHFPPGQLYPVNNKRPEVQGGLKAYASILDIPNPPVDMAVITVPAKHVPSVVEECGQKGVVMAVIITAGFKEMGEGGKALEDRVMEIAKRYGTRIIGELPRLIIPPKGIDTTYVHESPPKPGNIASSPRAGPSSTRWSTGASSRT